MRKIFISMAVLATSLVSLAGFGLANTNAGFLDNAKQTAFEVVQDGVQSLKDVVVPSTEAYIVSSTGITIEASDVSSVSASAMQGVSTQYEITKFIGLFIMISAAGWVLTKLLGIKIGG